MIYYSDEICSLIPTKIIEEVDEIVVEQAELFGETQDEVNKEQVKTISSLVCRIKSKQFNDLSRQKLICNKNVLLLDFTSFNKIFSNPTISFF